VTASDHGAADADAARQAPIQSSFLWPPSSLPRWEGVLLAVNHGGDSDSTGSIAGNLLGLIHGKDGIPAEWLERLQLRDVIERVTRDLWTHFGAEQRGPCGDLTTTRRGEEAQGGDGGGGRGHRGGLLVGPFTRRSAGEGEWPSGRVGGGLWRAGVPPGPHRRRAGPPRGPRSMATRVRADPAAPAPSSRQSSQEEASLQVHLD